MADFMVLSLCSCKRKKAEKALMPPGSIYYVGSSAKREEPAPTPGRWVEVDFEAARRKVL
jgi:hypothetical protein